MSKSCSWQPVKLSNYSPKNTMRVNGDDSISEKARNREPYLSGVHSLHASYLPATCTSENGVVCNNNN